MQYKFINIPIFSSLEATEELNRFIRSHRVITIKSEMVQYNSNYFMSFVIEYVDNKPGGINPDGKKNNVDYKEVLSEEDFAIYSVYTIFTNDQLAKIVTNRVLTVSDLSKIPGIGKSKIENYSESFVDLMKSLLGK